MKPAIHLCLIGPLLNQVTAVIEPFVKVLLKYLLANKSNKRLD